MREMSELTKMELKIEEEIGEKLGEIGFGKTETYYINLDSDGGTILGMSIDFDRLGKHIASAENGDYQKAYAEFQLFYQMYKMLMKRGAARFEGDFSLVEKGFRVAVYSTGLESKASRTDQIMQVIQMIEKAGYEEEAIGMKMKLIFSLESAEETLINFFEGSKNKSRDSRKKINRLLTLKVSEAIEDAKWNHSAKNIKNKKV